MRLTKLSVLVLAAVIPSIGCGDDIRFPEEIDPTVTDPALNAVIPANGFTDRTIKVQISGDGTVFTDAAQVVFGTGITTDSVERASDSDLFATITISGTATLGLHDVIVTDGDNTLTLSQAFLVENPIDIFTIGALEQGGGFVTVLIVNRDTDNPFLGVVDVTAGTGTSIIVNEAASTEYRVFATAFFDTDAATGQVVVTDTLGNDVVTSRNNVPLTVAARTAVPMTPVGKGSPNFTTTATLSGSSALFTFSSSMLFRATATAALDADDNPLGLPILITLENGKWANARGFVDDTFDIFGGLDPIPVTTDPMFVVVFDRGSLVANGVPFTNYGFDLDIQEDASLTGVVKLAQTEGTNGDENTTQLVPAGQDVTLFSGTLDPPTDATPDANPLDDIADVDVIKVTALAGQTIRVRTTSGLLGNADTDPFVIDTDFDEVCLQDFSCSFLAFSFDSFLGEDIVTGPLPADGDYFVVIAPSFFADALGEPYEAAIIIEDSGK